MHAEIVAIGTEILLGELVDTNSATIAKKLQSIGLPLHYTSTVGDQLDRIVGERNHVDPLAPEFVGHHAHP